MQPQGYEVYGHAEGRWFLDSAHADKGPAVARAREVAQSPGSGYERVAVFEERRFRPRNVHEESCVVQPGAAVRVEPIAEAPVCDGLADYYGLPARLTVGRLLRQYLDTEGITPLELLHDTLRLRRLMNDHTLAPKALGQVAGLQAQAQGVPHNQRMDALFRAADAVQRWAHRTQTRRGLVRALERDGIPGVRAALPSDASDTAATIYTSGALAHYLRTCGDWDDKVAALAELAARDDGDTLAAADGAIAEILDAPEAVRRIVDWHPQLDGLETGLRGMIRLACGDSDDAMPTQAAERVRALAEHQGLPRTRGILLDRVDRGLRGLQPLRREGGGDGEALAGLVRGLTTAGGVVGGPTMAAALTRRARLAFADGEEDLAVADAVARVLARITAPGARLGYLLALAASSVGRDHPAAVQGHLARFAAGLAGVESLVPADGPPLHAVVRDLTCHLRDLEEAGVAGAELRAELDSLLRRSDGRAASA